MGFVTAAVVGSALVGAVASAEEGKKGRAAV